MEIDNLWTNIPSADTPPEGSTENIVEIMKKQGEYLKEYTNGKVFARFGRIKNIPVGLAKAIQALSAATSEVVIETSGTAQLADANELYSEQRYGFEIYNQTYKFRIFETILTPIYPITISFDEGILEDSKDALRYTCEKTDDNSNYIMYSDEQLLDSLKIVFSSKKVRYILYRLQRM